jgi:hypothetical protein
VFKRRAAKSRAARERAAEKRAAEKRAAEKRAAEKRAAESRAAKGRSAEKRSAKERAAEKRAAESRAAESRSAEKRAAKVRPAKERSAEERSARGLRRDAVGPDVGRSVTPSRQTVYRAVLPKKDKTRVTLWLLLNQYFLQNYRYFCGKCADDMWQRDILRSLVNGVRDWKHRMIPWSHLEFIPPGGTFVCLHVLCFLCL